MKINEQKNFNRDPETCPHEQPWVFSPEPGVLVSKCRECGAQRADIAVSGDLSFRELVKIASKPSPSLPERMADVWDPHIWTGKPE